MKSDVVKMGFVDGWFVFVVGRTFDFVEVVGIGLGVVNESIDASEENIVREGALGLKDFATSDMVAFEILYGEFLDTIAVGGGFLVEISEFGVVGVVKFSPEVAWGVEIEAKIGFSEVFLHGLRLFLWLFLLLFSLFLLLFCLLSFC